MGRTRTALVIVISLVAAMMLSAAAGAVGRVGGPPKDPFVTIGGFGTNPGTGEKVHVTGKISCKDDGKKSKLNVRDDSDTFTATGFSGDCEDLDGNGEDGSWVGSVEGLCNGLPADSDGDIRFTDGDHDGSGGYGYEEDFLVTRSAGSATMATTDSLSIILRPKPALRVFSAINPDLCAIEAEGTFQGSIQYHG